MEAGKSPPDIDSGETVECGKSVRPLRHKVPTAVGDMFDELVEHCVDAANPQQMMTQAIVSLHTSWVANGKQKFTSRQICMATSPAAPLYPGNHRQPK